MARFIQESKIIDQKIQENISLALNDFTVKIGGKPTYCRYFHRNTTMTESDPVLNTVYKNVGTSSPVVYKEEDKRKDLMDLFRTNSLKRSNRTKWIIG